MAEITPALLVGNIEDHGLEESFPDAAHYRSSTGDEKCSNCLHYLKGVCHFWNVKAQKDMTCNDWKTDGEGKHYATLTEMFHPNGGLSLDEQGDGLIWKEALATGIWAMTPGPGQKPQPKPLIVKYDSQDPKHISLKKLVDHFEQRAVDHVTVPLSHADRVDENTGFVEALKIVEDAKRQGHHKLLAGYRFTEPDILAKVTNGTIANNSVGILFDYVRKRDGKIFPQVLAHIALTNRPWIDGLAPFGIAASEEHEYVVLSAVPMVEEPPRPTIGYTPAHARTREAQISLLSEDGPLGKPGNKKNWVDKVGGLPRYIRRIARDLIEERGFDTSHAIATAVSRCKLWAATSKNAAVRAKASAAIAQWEKMKVKSHVKTAAKSLNAGDADGSNSFDGASGRDSRVGTCRPGGLRRPYSVSLASDKQGLRAAQLERRGRGSLGNDASADFEAGSLRSETNRSFQSQQVGQSEEEPALFDSVGEYGEPGTLLDQQVGPSLGVVESTGLQVVGGNTAGEEKSPRRSLLAEGRRRRDGSSASGVDDELRLAVAQSQRLFLASHMPGWWKGDLHPRWPKGHPKGGKFLTKGEIQAGMKKLDSPKMSRESKGEAISAGPHRQRRQEFTSKVHKLTDRVVAAVSQGQKEDKLKTGAKSKTSTYLKDDPGKGISMTGKTNQKALLDFVNRARTQPSTFELHATEDPETGEHTYSKSRQELHEKIIDCLMRKRLMDKKGNWTILDPNGEYLTPEDTPGVVFSGGGYAAGKGSVIRNLRDAGRLPGQGTETEPDNHLLLDPDEIKALLPEFLALVNKNDPEANLVVYEEAWDIAQEIQARAQEKKLNMVVDGISNTSPGEMLGRVKTFTDAGYVDPLLVYVDIPTPEALTRSADRAETATDPKDIRHIPEVIMRAVHRDVAATIPGVMNGAPDHGLTVEVWDNNQGFNEATGVGVTPKLIASITPAKPGSTGGRPQIKIERGSEQLWAALLMKGHESISGVIDPGPGAVSGALQPHPKLSQPGGGLTVTKAPAAPKSAPIAPKPALRPRPRARPVARPAAPRPARQPVMAGLSEAHAERYAFLATNVVEADVKSYMRGGFRVREHHRHVKHLLPTSDFNFKPVWKNSVADYVPSDEHVRRAKIRGRIVVPPALMAKKPDGINGSLWVDGIKDALAGENSRPPLNMGKLGKAYEEGHKIGVAYKSTRSPEFAQKLPTGPQKKYATLEELQKAMDAQGQAMDWDAVGDARNAMRSKESFIRPGHGEHTLIKGSRPLTANPPEGAVVDDAFIAKLLFDTPQKPDEPVFVWHARLMAELTPEVKHKVIFAIREKYPPVDFVAEGMARWRKEHGLPEPTTDVLTVPASMEKATAVATAFDGINDMSENENVKAAFEDFKRQNEEMYQFITKPESEGGLGITVDFGSPTDEAYESAKAQAEDVRKNKHFQVQSGLGGDHPLLTTEEYDRFRAVHDIFGHIGVGGGFDRHGEYEAWLAHMTMYSGLGATAMSSEYHGVNSSMWAGKGTSTGRAVMLPEHLIVSPWMPDGSLRPDHGVVRNPTHLSEEEIRALDITDSAIELLLKGMGLTKEEAGVFASKYDSGPLHGDGRRKYQQDLKDAQDRREKKP